MALLLLCAFTGSAALGVATSWVPVTGPVLAVDRTGVVAWPLFFGTAGQVIGLVPCGVGLATERVAVRVWPSVSLLPTPNGAVAIGRF